MSTAGAEGDSIRAWPAATPSPPSSEAALARRAARAGGRGHRRLLPALPRPGLLTRPHAGGLRGGQHGQLRAVEPAGHAAPGRAARSATARRSPACWPGLVFGAMSAACCRPGWRGGHGGVVAERAAALLLALVQGGAVRSGSVMAVVMLAELAGAARRRAPPTGCRSRWSGRPARRSASSPW
ncbi:MAG: hypothetical protein MZW92_23520 [Comamonadaceae bacterium]|nr:hypothetical protein [Comamonadaceae bacterium]